MTTLLQINSSIFANAGQSSRLAERFVEAWRAVHPDGEVVLRDLGRDPVPHLDEARFGAFLAKPADHSSEQAAAAAYSQALIDELRAADVIVLGVPMYNFGIPSALKAYFDHVARAGITFRYTESGPVGMLKGKTAYVFATRGGRYAGTPRDSQTTYIRDFLAFLGIDDVHFVYAEGLAISEAKKEAGLAQAHALIDSLAARLAARVPAPEALAA
jgi:FMN-dependent NADH-azoreductase